jgi:hypothetical protein
MYHILWPDRYKLAVTVNVCTQPGLLKLGDEHIQNIGESKIPTFKVLLFNNLSVQDQVSCWLLAG